METLSEKLAKMRQDIDTGFESLPLDELYNNAKSKISAIKGVREEYARRLDRVYESGYDPIFIKAFLTAYGDSHTSANEMNDFWQRYMNIGNEDSEEKEIDFFNRYNHMPSDFSLNYKGQITRDNHDQIIYCKEYYRNAYGLAIQKDKILRRNETEDSELLKLYKALDESKTNEEKKLLALHYYKLAFAKVNGDDSEFNERFLDCYNQLEEKHHKAFLLSISKTLEKEKLTMIFMDAFIKLDKEDRILMLEILQGQYQDNDDERAKIFIESVNIRGKIRDD